MNYRYIFYLILFLPNVFLGMGEPDALRLNQNSTLVSSDLVKAYKAESLKADADICGICHEAGNLTTLSCFPTHKFHKDPCLAEWRKVNAICPLCRRSLPPTLSERLKANKGSIVGGTVLLTYLTIMGILVITTPNRDICPVIAYN